MKIRDFLTAAGQRMSSQLRERIISHPGELGSDREEILRQFLRSHLPKRFDVSSGFVFDCRGHVSKQIDIIVADAQICPVLETSGGRRVFPCECVVAIGQVKSQMTSRKLFLEALENLESVKSLDRSGGGKAYSKEYDELIDHRSSHLHQIFSFLIVLNGSLKADTARSELLNYVLKKEVHVWPNVLLSLDRYLITYCCDGGVCPNPLHARGIALAEQNTKDDLLLRFYLLLGRAIDTARVSSFPYWEYLSQLAAWESEVIYSATDDPPPYLSTLQCPQRA